ncbi:MAG TPA: sodium:proton antiporter [Thermodesulfobacteriota bacterium]|nr:sodium:proton antiporter [Thermodesulfobacteriota bacterium]
MSEFPLIGIASIIALGIGAQWLAWRFRLPSILLLLILGFVAGPVTGFLNPDVLFGELLLPVVSLSVSIILFEGGLSLRLSELKEVGRVVFNLITIGVLITWLATAVLGQYLLGLDFSLAMLLGAILVVTGPTVIVPLLMQIRPVGRIGSIVKWEGIVNDPIGAVLALLVFKGILASGFREATSLAAIGIFKAVFIGLGVGLSMAAILIVLLKRYWIPDFLHNSVSLMMVVLAFTVSDSLQNESGLLAVTVMGIALANQNAVSVRHIVEFKESLRVLLISSLFIILAARLPRNIFDYVNPDSLFFLALLILFVRPLAVLSSTLNSRLGWPEKAFLAWMAPRGIVAAALCSIFALRLEEAGNAQAHLLVPITFLVITGTVAVYGLSASPLARWLRLAKPNPQGCLFIGASQWVCEIAVAIREEGYQVLMVDANWMNISTARKMGLPVFRANILSKSVLDKIELDGIGYLVAVTPNDEVNSLAALHFRDVLGRSNVYQLSPMSGGKEGRKEDVISEHLRGRTLFGPEETYYSMTSLFDNGAVVKRTHLTDDFDYNAFRSMYGDKAISLFLARKGGEELVVYAEDNVPTPKPGQTLVSLVIGDRK